MKPKKCKTCKQPFTPFNSIQPTCGKYDCQVAFAENHAKKIALKRQRIERKELREAKQRIKKRSQWLKEAQREFNRYIRLRDKGKPCICCGKPLGENEIGGSYDCGHYRSVGSAPHLRFDERNAHAQRKHCNRYGSGRAVDYRIGLVARYGLVFVEALEADQTPKHYTIDDIKAIKEKYRLLSRALEKGQP